MLFIHATDLRVEHGSGNLRGWCTRYLFHCIFCNCYINLKSWCHVYWHFTYYLAAHTTVVIQQPSALTSSPQQIFCPTCNRPVVTKIDHHNGRLTWLSCILIFLFGWGFFNNPFSRFQPFQIFLFFSLLIEGLFSVAWSRFAAISVRMWTTNVRTAIVY